MMRPIPKDISRRKGDPKSTRPSDPQHWRDSQQMGHVLGKYIISDKPMSEEEWAPERADVLDAEPAFGDGREEHKAHADKLLVTK
jgi:hypothetical protein